VSCILVYGRSDIFEGLLLPYLGSLYYITAISKSWYYLTYVGRIEYTEKLVETLVEGDCSDHELVG
jgi:hypothetical protein